MGPKLPAWAATRVAQRLRPHPRSPRLQRAEQWVPPRPREGSIKPRRAGRGRHSSVTPSSHSSVPPELLLGFATVLLLLPPLRRPMAPKRLLLGAKGRAAAAATAAAAALESKARAEALERAMPPTLMNAAALDEARHMAAADSNEGRATVMKLPDGSLPVGMYPVFLHALCAGLVPPFSEFLVAILNFYQIRLLHLHPNSILTLSIFAFFCEAYIGIRPSVGLFRCFYSLRNTAPGEILDCVSFRLAAARSGKYIPVAWRGEKAITEVMKKAEGFRLRWFLADAMRTSPFLEAPMEPPVRRSSWRSAVPEGGVFAAVFRYIEGCRQAGVTGQLVAKNFVGLRIAPLQWHSEPMWTYSGVRDPMRLSEDDFSPEDLGRALGVLFTGPLTPEPASDRAKPLFWFDEPSIDERRQALPIFDEWGIIPRGLRGPRYNPWATESAAVEGPEDASEGEGPSDDEEVFTGSAPDGGEAPRGSSPRPGAPEAAADKVPSPVVGEEGAAATSQAVEGEGVSSGRRGYSELRSEHAHDDGASTTSSTPRETRRVPAERGQACGAPTPAKKKRWAANDE